jgi:hypothetical protein
MVNSLALAGVIIDYYPLVTFKLGESRLGCMDYLPIQKLYMLFPVLVMLAYLGLAVLIAFGFKFVDPKGKG